MKQEDLNQSKMLLEYYVNGENYSLSCSYMRSNYIIDGKAYFFVKFAISDPNIGDTDTKRGTIKRIPAMPPEEGWTKEEFLKVRHKYE
ncbi:hypothetical protein EI427_17320 [Flammeovirga pectinis]|uniref:Uncharacterized protein n=1 Tax=Flammeovirga pectinis TaxID=2494373 RepID=A0A3Q9FQY1_9BACT|nr:hypothetical protein [Flammeovirga pectinis]AZQ63921.1 hypothetical protein EI427_17320 [Flammeovirga pectinis]